MISWIHIFVYLLFSLYSLFPWELDLTLLEHLAGQLNLLILVFLEEVSVTYNNLWLATNVIQFSLFISGKMTLMKPLNAFREVNLLLVDPFGVLFHLVRFCNWMQPYNTKCFYFPFSCIFRDKISHWCWRYYWRECRVALFHKCCWCSFVSITLLAMLEFICKHKFVGNALCPWMYIMALYL